MKKNKEKKRYWEDNNVLHYDYLPWGYVPNWFRNAVQFFRNCKYAWQRIVKGYCDYDIWSLDQYLTIMIANALTELNETRHGYPAEMTDEEWSRILQEISERLLNSLEDNEDTEVWKTSNKLWEKMNSYETDRDFVERDDGLYGMDIKVSDEGKYKEAREEWLQAVKEAWEWREAEKDKALDLLKQFWFSMWD